MSTKMSQGALNLLKAIETMPGHTGDDYRTLSELSRNQWNKLSGELRRNNLVYTERATVTKNGREVAVFKWYAGEKPVRNKKRNTKRTPPALRKKAPKPTETTTTTTEAKPNGYNFRVPRWTSDELSLLKEKFEEGLTDEQIAEFLPLRNKSSVRQRRGILGLRHFSRKGRGTKNQHTHVKYEKDTELAKKTTTAKKNTTSIARVDSVQSSLVTAINELVDARIQMWLKEHGITNRLNELEKKVAELSSGQSSKDAEQDAKLDSVRSSLANLTNLLKDL